MSTVQTNSDKRNTTSNTTTVWDRIVNLENNLGGVGGTPIKEPILSQLTQIATNVKMFGALGDGVTDDSPAFQLAINSLGDNGGEVFIPIPDVDFYIGSPVILKDNIRVVGASKGCYITTKGNYSAFISEGVNDPTKGIADVSIKNLSIRDHSSVYKDKYTIELANAYNCKVENVTIDAYDRTKPELSGIYFSKKNEYDGNCFVNKIIDCQLRNASAKIESTDSIIDNSEIWGHTRSFAVHLVKSSQVISNCQIVGSSVKAGVWVEDTLDNFDVEIIKINNTYFDGSYDAIDSGKGIYAVNMKRSTISGNTFWRQMDEGLHLTGGYSNSFNGNTFTNCNRRDDGKSDMKIESQANVIVANTFHRDVIQTNQGKALEIINEALDKNTVVGNRVFFTSYYLPSDLDDPTSGGINH